MDGNEPNSKCKSNYTTTPLSVEYDKRLSSSERRLYSHIVFRCNSKTNKGRYIATYSQLSQDLALSEHKIGEAIKVLKTVGLIMVRKVKSNSGYPINNFSVGELDDVYPWLVEHKDNKREWWSHCKDYWIHIGVWASFDNPRYSKESKKDTLPLGKLNPCHLASLTPAERQAQPLPNTVTTNELNKLNKQKNICGALSDPAPALKPDLFPLGIPKRDKDLDLKNEISPLGIGSLGIEKTEFVNKDGSLWEIRKEENVVFLSKNGLGFSKKIENEKNAEVLEIERKEQKMVSESRKKSDLVRKEALESRNKAALEGITPATSYQPPAVKTPLEIREEQLKATGSKRPPSKKPRVSPLVRDESESLKDYEERVAARVLYQHFVDECSKCIYVASFAATAKDNTLLKNWFKARQLEGGLDEAKSYFSYTISHWKYLNEVFLIKVNNTPLISVLTNNDVCNQVLTKMKSSGVTKSKAAAASEGPESTKDLSSLLRKKTV